MGNIGYKVAAQFFHLIGLKDKLFQVTAQGIQGAAQISHFILPVYDNLQGVIAGSNGLGAVFMSTRGRTRRRVSPDTMMTLMTRAAMPTMIV